MDEALLGVEIGGTKLQIVVGSPTGTMQYKFRHDVKREDGAAGIRRVISQTLGRLLPHQTLAAVGVGFGGPVDWRTGRICCSHHVEGWSEFVLGEWLQALAGAPTRVDNDANVAALGETWLGAGQGLNPVFYVTLGSGVGGGLVVEGRIYHGATPGESEIGHVRLDRSGQTVESRCSGWAMDRRIRELVGREPQGALAQLVGREPGKEARHLPAALAQGDAAARRLLHDLAEDLAFALSHAVHLFHPAALVLGGGLSLVGEPLRAAVASMLPRFVMQAFQPPPRVLLAGLGEDAVPIGALRLAAQSLDLPGS